MHSKHNILFSSVHTGVSGPKKRKEAWQHITDAVNAVSSVNQTVPEVKRKWFEMKLDCKKRITSFRQNRIHTGGPPSSCDERIIRIIGEPSLLGIIPDGDSDEPPLQENNCHNQMVRLQFY